MRNLELFFESGESTLTVRRFVVNEAISRPFEVSVVARSPNAEIDLESIVGKRAGFALRTGVAGAGPSHRVWSGVCRHMELLRAELTGASSYFLVIVPTLWLSRQRVGCRIHQHQSAVDIVKKVLGEWNIEPKLSLTKEHPKLDYVVQWRESDFDFVSRLLERDGISYSFAFHDDRTELVLDDDPTKAKARPPVPYHDDVREAHIGEFARDVSIKHEVRPGRVTVRDYDFRKKPDYKLLGHSEWAPAPEDFYEQYHYAPGAFACEVEQPSGTPVADDKGIVRHDEKRGKQLAEWMLHASRRGKRVVFFDCNVIGLSPGTVFALEGHPRADLAASKPLLVTDFTIHGKHDGEWAMSGEAHFADDPFAPVPLTPKPRIAGVQVATVVGRKDQEIHTDEHGRVRVQFPWDRDGKLDDGASCWLRVSQAWAGSGYGAIDIPRVGQEVWVAFFEGDPDQPVVVGRAYNATQPHAYPLPGHKTKSSWKSDSTPKAEGFNEVRFEDLHGKELVYLQAQRDLQKLVKHDETERTGKNRFIVVGDSRRALVVNSDATMVGERWSLQMVKPPREDELKIRDQAEPKVEPLATKVEMIDERVMTTTGPAQVVLHKRAALLQCKGALDIKAGGNVIIEGGPYIRIN
jgi:type VI secretion system secreted protein VgrG